MVLRLTGATCRCLYSRTGRFVTIGTLRWHRGRTWTLLIFTSPVSFPVNDSSQQAWLMRRTFDLMSSSNGFYHLHPAGWDGARHAEEVSAPSSPVISWLAVCVSGEELCSVCVCVKVQPRGSGVVCEHRPRVGCHRGLGYAVEFVPADGSQRPLHLWPHCLQRIQICWVNISFCPLWVRLKPWLHIESTLKCSPPLFQDNLHHALWPPVWQWWLFCGTSLVLLCPDVLHCKYLEQGCPGFIVRQGQTNVQRVFSHCGPAFWGSISFTRGKADSNKWSHIEQPGRWPISSCLGSFPLRGGSRTGQESRPSAEHRFVRVGICSSSRWIHENSLAGWEQSDSPSSSQTGQHRNTSVGLNKANSWECI